MKKTFFIVLMVFSLFVLWACGRDKDSELSPDLFDANIDVLEYDPVPVIENIDWLDHLEDVNILSLNAVAFGGVVILENAESHLGVYSLLTDEMVIPFDEDISNFVTYPDSVFGIYIRVFYTDGESALFDVLGNVVLAKDDYLDIQIEGAYIADIDLYLEIVEHRFFGQDWVMETYEVDIATGERTEYEYDGFETYHFGDAFDIINKIDLKPFGLEGYYYTISADFIRVYDEEDNSMVTSFLRPTPAGAWFQKEIFGGFMFYQVFREVPLEDDEYTFISEGNKYLMATQAIDFQTGQRENLAIDYVIADIAPFLDEDGIAQYAWIEAYHIIDNHLAEEVKYEYIIDADGKVIANVSGMNIHDLERISEDRIFNHAQREILDNDLNHIFTLPWLYDWTGTFVPEAGIFIFEHNGKMGAVDTDGTIVIPFDYQYISPHFYQGKTIVEDHDNFHWIIDLEGNRQHIDYPYVNRLNMPGVYVTYTDPDIDGNVDVFIQRYDRHPDNPVLTITTQVADPRIILHHIDTAFISGYIIRIQKLPGPIFMPNNYYFIVID